jgi:hypothetical protein
VRRIPRHAWPAIASALAALLACAITLGGTFIYDDFDVFANDARLRVPAQWSKYWTESYNGGVDNLYRPLVSMTYAIQWLLHGDRFAWPYHLVNWLIHAAVAACVAELARRLTPSPCTQGEGGGEGSPSSGRSLRVAYLAGLLFAVHPIHVEAVANIVGRAELMCALGTIGALTLMAHRPLTIARALAIFACATVAVLSKEQGLLVGVLLLGLGYAMHFRAIDQKERTALRTLVILICWSTAGYVLFRERILRFSWERSLLDWTINPLTLASGADRWLVPIAILGRYMSLLFFPIRLSPDYGGEVIGWTIRTDDPYLYLGFAALLAWLACAFAALRSRDRAALFALVGLALTYGMISNLVMLIGTNFGERLMYLPSAFFLIYVAMLLARLPKWVVIAFCGIAIVAASVRTFSYARRWNDRLSFYEWAAQSQPKSIRLRMLIIAELMSQGRLDEAAAEAAKARQLLPQYHEIWIQSADVDMKLGRLDEAEAFLKHAIRIAPRGVNINKATGRLEVLSEKRAAATSQPATQP